MRSVTLTAFSCLLLAGMATAVGAGQGRGAAPGPLGSVNALGQS